MHRVDTDGHVGNLFNQGDPTVPRAPTQVDPAILNAFQEEHVNAIIDPGTALVKGTNTQHANEHAMMLCAPGGRLSVDTGGTHDPVADTNDTVVTYFPYAHNRVAVYNGTRWELKKIPDAGVILIGDTTTLAADTNYDCFLWDNAGTLTGKVGPAWTSGTARGAGAGTTELERKDGRWTNKVAIAGGPAANCGLYVGTFRTDGSKHVNDLPTKRHLWNAFNRVDRAMANAAETADTWAYNSATIRQANANTANQLNFVIGLDEDAVIARVSGLAGVTGAGTTAAYVGIGLDSTSARVAGSVWDSLVLNTGNVVHTVKAPVTAQWSGRPGIGSHFLAWLEQTTATAGVTFYGDGTSTSQSGIVGVIRA
jgi:hypothetical protein